MARLRVEVVYAFAQTQDLVALELAQGAVAREAVEASGLLVRHAELDAARLRLGVFGRLIRPEQLLEDGDRVEILRPLAMDPREARRLRARRRGR